MLSTALQTENTAEAPAPSPKKQRARRLRLGRLGRGILWRVALFALLSLALIVVMVIYVAWRQYADTQLLQEQVTKWTTESLDRWIQEIDYGLVATARPGLLDVSDEVLAAELERILDRSPTYRSVTLVDARVGRRGQEIMSVSRGEISSGFNYHGVAWFHDALDLGHSVSRVDLSTAIPLVTVARVIREGDQPVGVIAAEADLGWARDLLVRARTERESYVYVADGLGRAILHEDSHFVYPQRVRKDEIVGIQAALSGVDLPLLYPGLNPQGEQVFGVYRKMQETNWVVIGEQPLHVVAEGLLPIVLGAIGVFLLSAVAAAVVWIYISRGVARPIALLGEGTQRIGTGDLEHRILLRGRNELTDLAEEFNRMTENLQASQARLETWSHELEDRVGERTIELSQALQQLQQEAEVRENLIRTIREISSPVIPVMEGIIVMPIVGTLDSERARRVVEDLLLGIERGRARVVIIDITGLAVVDTAVANALLHAARASQLLGARPILVGIAPEVAETLVQLGVEIRDLRTAATLQEGLRVALAMLRRQVTPI